MKKTLFILFQLVFVFNINAQILRYTSTQTYLRAKPNFSSKKVATVSKGAKINLSKTYYKEWIPINYKGQKAYLYSGFLTSKNPNSNYLYRNNSYSSQQNYRINSKRKYYINSRGQKVQSPTYYKSAPKGATARCRDGTYSFSKSRRGTCSGHGGVAKWLK